MSEWFEFALYVLQHTVESVFDLDLGLGFSLGDLEVALLIIGIVATALVVKIGSAASQEVSGAKSYTEKLDRKFDAQLPRILRNRGYRRKI